MSSIANNILKYVENPKCFLSRDIIETFTPYCHSNKQVQQINARVSNMGIWKIIFNYWRGLVPLIVYSGCDPDFSKVQIPTK